MSTYRYPDTVIRRPKPKLAPQPVQPRCVEPLDWWPNIEASECFACGSTQLTCVVRIFDTHGREINKFARCQKCGDKNAEKTGAVDLREATGTSRE